MNETQPSTPTGEVARILDSAKRLGIELDEQQAIQWLTAMAASKTQDEVVVDTRAGVFGHRITMLDFSPEDLNYFRQIGKLVEFEDKPGVVETALALSGSSAQSKIQTYPGDCDYFERVNIIAPTRTEACRILGQIIRDKVSSAMQGPTYQLIEVKFGSYPRDVNRGDHLCKKGTPVSWKPSEISAGQFETKLPDGSPFAIRWDDVANDPGWCKLDWVIADPKRGRLANASNMLDVTWQAPDGSITPLDGFLDPYFQEVYLDVTSVPIFSKLAQHVSANALDDYVSSLQHEVQKYLSAQPANYGKAAKRMYNIFRLTGKHEEAAFLRELFDEPTTMLYQVWSLIRTIDDAFQPGGSIPLDNLLAQADQLITSVVAALEGDVETEIVRQLLKLRDALTRQRVGESLGTEAEAARAQVINIVNNFFHEKLTGLPTIKAYMEEMQSAAKS